MLSPRERAVARLGLLTSAVVWGLIWYPYRQLEAGGLPGLQASLLTYAWAFLLGCLLFWQQLSCLPALFVRQPRRAGVLLLMGLAAGGANMGYVLAVLQGEVMRVVLLFYLAPLWTVLLAWLILGERLQTSGVQVVLLCFTGALVMLWQPALGWPWPQAGAEWLALAAGFLFALSNVLAREAQDLSVELKSLAVFGGAVVVGVLIWPWVMALADPQSDSQWTLRWLENGEQLALLLLLGSVLLLTNLVAQYGLTHTAANQAIVIYLFELVVAAVSSHWLAQEYLGWRECLGGGLIVMASLYSERLAENACLNPEGPT